MHAIKPSQTIMKNCLLQDIFTNQSSKFGFYDAAIKAIYHRENFSNFLMGKYDKVKPVSVEIVPSLECNFMCPNCTYVQNLSKARLSGSKKVMSAEIFQKVLNNITNFGIKSLVFTGGGEPFMNKKTIEYIKLARKSSYEVGVYTNGFKLTENIINQLTSLDLTFVRISLNAATYNSHGKIFGYAKNTTSSTSVIFNKVVNNLILLGRSKLRNKSKTTVGVSFILGHNNFDEIKLLPDILRKLDCESQSGIDYAAIRPEVQYFTEALNSPEKQLNAVLFKRIPNLIKNEVLSMTKDLSMQILFNKGGFIDLSKQFVKEDNVAAPWSVSIDYDGQLYPTSEHNGAPGFSLGDLSITHISQLWETKYKTELFSKLKTIPYFKLKTLNDLLLKIKKIGVFSKEEVAHFYARGDLSHQPSHVNFF